jgi:hypothetical protein
MTMKTSSVKRKLTGLIIAIFVFTSVFSFYPKKVGAVPSIDVASAALVTKEYALDTIAWIVAKRVLQGVLNSLTNWADTGFEGGPQFAVNPEELLLNAGDQVAGQFIKSIGAGNLCSPFASQVKRAVVIQYNLSRVRAYAPYDSSCTLSDVIQNVDSFISGDFNQGGWEGWFELTQVDTNNPYGAYLNVQQELNARLGSEKGKQLNLLNWSKGFLSQSDCETRDSSGNCAKWGPVKTPGSVLEGKLTDAFGSDIRTLELSDELDELLAALANTLIGKIFGAGQDLFTGEGITAGGGVDELGNVGSDIGEGSDRDFGDPDDGLPSTLTIYIIGPNPLEWEHGTPYVDLGAYALDPVDGSLNAYQGEITTSGNVDVNTAGTYTITYTATNSRGQSVSATRSVVVKPKPVDDTTGGGTNPPGTNNPPTITLAPPISMQIPTGGSFMDPGYTAFDSEDGDISLRVLVSGQTVNTFITGMYSLNYTVTDSGGLSARATRFISVGLGGGGGQQIPF